MSKETRRFFSTFSTRNFESFRRERLPVWRRTRTTQEKLISEFYEVTGPTGPARAKGDICVHKEVGVHNGNPLLLYVWYDLIIWGSVFIQSKSDFKSTV